MEISTKKARGGNQGVMLALALAGALWAGAGAAQEADIDPDVFCDELAGLAEALMDVRQSGGELGFALGVAGDSDLIRSVVLDAWRVPRMSVPENQQREVSDFRDRWHLLCLDSF